VEIEGEEGHKRHALASYFLVYFYEELVESLYFLQQGKNLEEKILGYFSPQYLALVDQLVNHRINKEQTRLADSDYIGLVVHICLTLQRTHQHYLLGHAAASESTAEQQVIAAVGAELNGKLGIRLTAEDIQFLAVILKGSKVQ